MKFGDILLIGIGGFFIYSTLKNGSSGSFSGGSGGGSYLLPDPGAGSSQIKQEQPAQKSNFTDSPNTSTGTSSKSSKTSTLKSYNVAKDVKVLSVAYVDNISGLTYGTYSKAGLGYSGVIPQVGSNNPFSLK